MADFGEENLILLNPIQSTKSILTLYHKIQISSSGTTIYYAGSPVSGHMMVKANIGICIMPNFVILSDSEISMVPLEVPDVLSYGIAHLKGDNRREVAQFVLSAKEYFKENNLF